MSLAKIQLKYGTGHPGLVLDLSEPAFDALNNLLYIGKGIGSNPIQIGSTGGSSYLSTLLDVSINNLLNGQVLAYDASSLLWKNHASFYFDKFKGGSDWTTALIDYVYGGTDWTTGEDDKIYAGTW